MELSILPIIPIKTSIANDRMSRVQRLSVLFETNRIFINPNLDEWINEIRLYPRGAHDDTIDSLSFAIQASQETNREKNIDWGSIPDLIHSKTIEPVSHVNKYRIKKIGR